MPDFFMTSIVFILGACIGSFLNVCIVRMPHEKSVVFPGSHCCSCKKPIAWYDNIPLLSYIFLGGKCRHCGARFSFRYFLVEFVTAGAFVGLYMYFGLDQKLIAYCIMIACFIVATFVDFEHRIIPDEISIGGMFIGLGLSVFLTDLHAVGAQELAVGRIVMRSIVGICLLVHVFEFLRDRKEFDRDDLILLAVIVGLAAIEGLCEFLTAVPFKDSQHWVVPHILSTSASLIGLLAGGGFIYAMGLLGDFIFRKESMGGGDVKLMALIGAFMGWKLTLLAFFIAPFFGAVYGIVEKIRTKDSAIAYGPFIVIGALVSLFYGDVIIAYIMGQYGL